MTPSATGLMAEPTEAANPTQANAYQTFWGDLSRPAAVVFDPQVSIMVAREFYDGPVRHLFGPDRHVSEVLGQALEKAVAPWIRQTRSDPKAMTPEQRELLLLRAPKPQGGSMRKIVLSVKADAKEWSRLVAARFGTGDDAPCMFLREILVVTLTRRREQLKREGESPSAKSADSQDTEAAESEERE